VFTGLKIGFGITGSFCTFDKIIPVLKDLKSMEADVFPILSEHAVSFDTRFWKAEEFKKQVEEICLHKVISNIIEAEPIGPKNYLDLLVVAPCTGNTISKLANAITDTSVTMASKAHLRNGKPLIIAISTNDGLSSNGKNIGVLLNTKNIYFVPFGQDDAIKKCNSLVADMNMIIPTIEDIIKGNQKQPILLNS
jgi:dipicolinate synthase subunit B